MTAVLGARCGSIFDSTDADPSTADIGNGARVEGVMVEGRWHDRADLDARLARVREAVR